MTGRRARQSGLGRDFSGDDVPLLDADPPDDLANGQTFAAGEARYWECGSSGFSAMLAWLCGPRTLRKFAERRVRLMQVTRGVGENRRTSWEPDAEFAQDIDEAVDDYLHAVGLRRRPAGFRWFQVAPDGLDPADIERAAVEAQVRVNRRHPADAVPAIRTALEDLYQASVPALSVPRIARRVSISISSNRPAGDAAVVSLEGACWTLQVLPVASGRLDNTLRAITKMGRGRK